MVDTAKTTVGGNVVVTSGSVVVLDDQWVEIIPRPVAGMPLKVRFSFASDSSGEAKVLSAPLGANVVQITLTNFDNPAGISVMVPIPVGTIAGRVVTVTFVANKIGTARQLTYTVFADGDDDV